MPSWNWNESQSESGVVHESVTNTDHNDAATLKQGYDYANFSEITPDPVACWPLHEDSGTTAYDVAGTNDGTVNGATVGQTGLLGTTAYSFDGVDDNVGLADNATVHPDTFTISAWINYTTLHLGNIYSKEINGPWCKLIVNDDIAQFTITDGSGTTYDIFGTIPLDDGEWHHVVGVYDGDVATIYVDGVSDAANSSPSGNQQYTNSAPRIGSRPNGGKPFDGRISSVSLYSQGLNQSQIQTLYDVVNTAGTWTGTAKPL